jgi:hypothetical protein
MRQWTLFLFSTLLSGLHLNAQEIITTIQGKITDARTGQPIPSVSLQLKPAGTGTSTNVKGEFVFKFSKSAGNDTLVFSCIGYKPVKKPLQTIGGNLSISLEPAIYELAAVTVNAGTALDMLKEAIRRIPENYDTSDVQLGAFYREDIWLGDFQLAFSEAVLDIYKTFKVAKQLNDQIRIVKGRKKTIDYGKEAQLYFWMSGVSNGARSSLTDDVAKYWSAKTSPFNPANARFYEYKYAGTVKEGERSLTVLDIIPRKKARKAIARVKVYLDEESLAIVKYNVDLSEQGIRYVSKKDKGLMYAIMSKVVHITSDYHKFNISVSYNQHNGKWYMNRVSRHFEILVSSKKRNWVDKVWRSDIDLVITAVDTANAKPITEGDVSKKDAPVYTMFGNDFDESFWENYNILKSEKADSLAINTAYKMQDTVEVPGKDSLPSTANNISELNKTRYSNRQNGFTKADTLRGKLTPLRTCYDVIFYHLDVSIDLEKKAIKGNNLVRFRVEHAFRNMQIDLYNNMQIDSIIYKNKSLRYRREFDAVFIEFPEEFRRGQQHEIKVFYQGIPQVPDWSIPMYGGVLWDKDSLGNHWAQVVCQGSGASLWWPNKDHQSDEPDSMKIWVTVPSDYSEISNGRLIAKTPQPGGRVRFEWFVSYPINNYNVSFSIGKYAHFTDRFMSDDTLTIDYYVMPYNLERAKKMFKQVEPMLKIFEKNFGKYPFKRDGFTLMESLYPMEHQSGVSIGKITQQNSGETNPLLWHEAAHEWWGNAITSKDIADMWIHEAFATYAETLVIEDLFGKEAAYESMADQANAVIGKEPITGVYDVNHIHYDIGDMYSKGSLMLHTFRNILNDDKKWVKLLKAIQQNFRYKTISADELISFISSQTGKDYNYFFDQYLHYTDIPTLDIELEESGRDLKIRYRWRANVKNFRMPARVTTRAAHFEFIYPTTEWKTVLLQNISASEFDVDDESLYINTNVE